MGRHGQNSDGKARALLIAGPTASGKSALAVAVAKAVHGAVVNADSMQVYADLHVLSARPDDDEMQGVPHHLYGHVDGAVNYSVGAWLKDMKALLPRLEDEGRMPVIVGGTGLYFKALTEGLSPMPHVPDAIKHDVRSSLAGLAPQHIHARLLEKDPVMAQRLRPSDTQRMTRALEVLAATGRSLALWQDAPREAPLLPRYRGVFLEVERDWLKPRIDRRFDLMMEQGALEEVKRLHARGLYDDLPVMRAHGVPGLVDYLDGHVSLDEAIEKGKRDTRAYAKRQVTWFRHQCPSFVAASTDRAFEVIV